jgi:HD domain
MSRSVSLPPVSADLHSRPTLTGDEAACLKTVVQTGTALVGTISIAIAAYALLTWDRPHRGVLVAAAAIGIAEGVVLWRAGTQLLGRLERPEGVIAAWCAAGIAVSALLCCLDDGVASPLGALTIVLVAFSAVALPARFTVGIAAVAVLALAVMVAVGPRPGSWEGFFILRVAGLLVTASVCAAIAGDRTRRIAALRDSQEEVPRRLARVIEFRDRDTGDHIGRMSDIVGLIARELGFDQRSVRRLRQASVMHDVGKVAIPDSILLKPGPLTDEERRVMQGHARAGFEMLTGSSSTLLELGATIALTHHERFDGAGYPDGLEGQDIPLAGRITAVVEQRGAHFDPQVVDALLRRLPEIAALNHERADDAVAVLAR